MRVKKEITKFCNKISLVIKFNREKYSLKGTFMQIEKVFINDDLGISKVI